MKSDLPLLMGRARNRPKLLPNKLRAIREFLNVRTVDMASKLQADMLSHSRKQYQIKGGRISEWENGRREPDLLVLLSYSRLAQVKMDSMIDDALSVEAFRERLGKELKHGRTVAQHTGREYKTKVKT